MHSKSVWIKACAKCDVDKLIYALTLTHYKVQNLCQLKGGPQCVLCEMDI